MTKPYRLAGLLALAFIFPAQAQEAPRKIFRGTIESLDGKGLNLKTTDGQSVSIHLTPDWKARLVAPISVEAIHAGSFIGTAQIPQADGSGKSLEVHVFPPGVKSGEGERDWDSKPGARMTNGTVGGEVVSTAAGREVTLTFPGGSRKIVIPPEVPVVQFDAAERTIIKPGIAVFVVAQPDGKDWRTNSVATGQNGAAPPM